MSGFLISAPLEGLRVDDITCYITHLFVKSACCDITCCINCLFVKSGCKWYHLLYVFPVCKCLLETFELQVYLHWPEAPWMICLNGNWEILAKYIDDNSCTLVANLPAHVWCVLMLISIHFLFCCVVCYGLVGLDCVLVDYNTHSLF